MAITDRVYVKNHRSLSASMDRNMPRNVFSGAALDLLYSTDELEKVDSASRERLLEFVADFMTCGCSDAPYCGCPEEGFVRYLIELRRGGLGPEAMIEAMESDYNLYAYEGDVYDFLDSVVRRLEAVEEMAEALGQHDTMEEAREIRDDVVNPSCR